ncbi:uncharacterized protein LOC131657446 [Vicia villosa]|uniref:uncharacterized protein LOC131657446 n=1 Tax=Vicia villosa TaxID=3911 RepID=UPI00273ADBFD|nr:uncharacterized protein LOC131657446 [Vicia villosa]
MIISWNVRGLNKAGKCREIAARLKKLNPDFGILVETRVKFSKKDSIRNKLGGHLSFIDNYQSHENGRLWIFWNPNKVCIKTIKVSDQFIHFSVYKPNGDFHMWGTAIYAHNTLEKRKVLWSDIESLAQISQGPWFLMGDFNNVMSVHDRIGGNPVLEHEFRDLRDMMAATGLFEKESSGDHFTWSNNQVNGIIYSRIDRVIRNVIWQQQHADSKLQIMDHGVLDHALLCLEYKMQQTPVHKSFRFPNVLLQMEGFESSVKENWCVEIEGKPMVRLWKKLKRLQQVVK